ncbi:UNVERIFIED_CONTAM: hypothetical protein Slati_3766100 [Sesamum latifolium]|uniref:Retrovirus-related Pol polyprotein from transposon opus n=1 Tax=Sesamum latifolium TaxID=2727402 RepID=A0AAW2U4A0_9LAMI
MPSSAKFLKEVLLNKRKWEEGETVKLNEECSAILQNKLPSKLKDPGSFSIPCTIGNIAFNKVLCDLADRSIKYPRGIVEDVLVKVGKFILPVDFIVLDMKEDNNMPLILGRPFLATSRALIDVQKGQLTLRVNDEQEMKEEHEEVPNFVDTGQEVKSKLQKELLLNGSTSNPKVKPPFEVSSDRKKASEGKWGRPNRMKRWRNQVDNNVGFYKEHTKAWNKSHMKKKKCKDGDKRHHKNKGPIKVDWQTLKHYIEGTQPPRLEPPSSFLPIEGLTVKLMTLNKRCVGGNPWIFWLRG